MIAGNLRPNLLDANISALKWSNPRQEVTNISVQQQMLASSVLDLTVSLYIRLCKHYNVMLTLMFNININ